MPRHAAVGFNHPSTPNLPDARAPVECFEAPGGRCTMSATFCGPSPSSLRSCYLVRVLRVRVRADEAPHRTEVAGFHRGREEQHHGQRWPLYLHVVPLVHRRCHLGRTLRVGKATFLQFRPFATRSAIAFVLSDVRC